MSHVTGFVLIHTEINRDDDEYRKTPANQITMINNWLATHYWRYRPDDLTEVQNHFGGNKHPQCTVIGYGFNHFPEDKFATFFLTNLTWDYP